MEKWNIDKHIKNHADYYFNKINGETIENGNYIYDNSFALAPIGTEANEENDKFFANRRKFTHFVISFNLIDFDNREEASRLLKMILEELKKYEIDVIEKNGVRRNKNGTVVQKYRKRKIKIGEWLLAGAIHTQGFDEQWIVNPHIHLLFDKKKAKLGKNFYHLKNAIVDIKKRLKIKQKTSFEDKNISISRKFKSVMNARSWAIRKGKNLQKKTLELFENDLIKYLGKSGNIEFVLKNYVLLNKKGKVVYGFYPGKLEKEINDFLNEAPTPIIEKLCRKEEIYIKNRIDSPLRFFLDNMGWKDEIIDIAIKHRTFDIKKVYEIEKYPFDNIIINEKKDISEILAVSVLKQINPYAKVTTVSPEDENIEECKKDKRTVLLKVGGDLNEDLNNFDSSKESVFKFILKKYGNEVNISKDVSKYVKDIKFIKEIEMVEKYGIKEASEIINNPIINSFNFKKIIKIILEADFNDSNVIDTIFEVLKKYTSIDTLNTQYDEQIDYQGFIFWIYKELKQENLLEEETAKVEKREKEILETIKQAEKIKKNNKLIIKGINLLKYADEVFEETEADILLDIDEKNPNRTVILKKTAEGIEKAVIDKNIDDIDVENDIAQAFGYKYNSSIQKNVSKGMGK